MERRNAKYAERYKDVLPSEAIEKVSQIQLPLYYFVSGFIHPFLPIIKEDGVFLYEWGLIPSWVKDTSVAKEMQSKTLNAVGETVFDKPSFRKSIVAQRCLLGISGFFEWRDINKSKYPYFIRTINEEVFSLGCIYESWVDKRTGEIRNTFSILTTPANPLLEKIHNIKKRMPLIISRQDEKNWISSDASIKEINALIKPFDEKLLLANAVSKFVNSPKYDRNVPEAISPFDYPELAPL